MESDRLLGENVANLLKELKDQLNNINAQIKTDPKKVFEISKNLMKTVGITNNLRGKLFEYFIATARYYENTYPFEVGKLITDPSDYTFNYYTLSDFEPDAVDFVNKIHKYKIKLFNKENIEQQIKKLKIKDLSTTYNDFFK